MEKYAKIDGNYRYLLGRKWDENLQQVTFLMLNPSTADHEQDDPTLRKCINFAKFWGYGSNFCCLQCWTSSSSYSKR